MPFTQPDSTSRLVRLLSTRCIQVLGNILKPVFYLDLWIRPNKRYAIPKFSPARRASSTAKAIPRIVWQTNRSNHVTLSLYVNYHFNRWISPTYEFRFLEDLDCERFIEEHSPSALPAYLRLRIGAAKADLWRVLVLANCGGVYLDADAAFSWPLDKTLHDCQTSLFVREKDGRLTNYFMACAPKHPVMEEIAVAIVNNIEADSIRSVYDMTGPTVVDGIAGKSNVPIEPSNSVCRQGQFTRKVFQYPDRLKGYWANEEKKGPIVSPLPDHQ